MKKTKLFLLGAILASFTFNASADEPFDPKNITSTYNHSERKLNSFTLTNTTGNEDGSLNAPTFTVGQTTEKGKSIYFDLRETTAPFQTKAGNTVTLSPYWNGGSMHGYVFIDYNQDGGFNSNFNNSKKDTYSEGFKQSLNASAEGELVSFSAYQVSGSFKNSDEDDVAGNVGVNPPSFKIPENLPVGIYDALYKIDWNNIDQHGCKDSSNLIGNNGGVIVHFRILVVDGTEYNVKVNPNPSDKSKGSVSLRVDGEDQGTETNITATHTVVAVAIPAPDHYFYNWTDDATGKVVSTDLEYNLLLTGNVSLTANFLNQEEFDNLPDEAFDPNKITSTYNRPSNDLKQLKNFKLTNVSGNENNILSEPEFDVSQSTTSGSKIYYDKTSLPPFQTNPGNIVKFDTIAWNYSWMHGYLYIDYNNDGGFNKKLNTGFEITTNKDKIENAIGIDTKRGELVSFWVYNVKDGEDDYFVDSEGTFFTKDTSKQPNYGSGVRASRMPQFKIPDNLPAGTYNALFKIDWNDLDQHGNKTETDPIGNNGGCIVKFQIKVVDPLYITSHTETNTSYTNAAIITIDYTTEGISEGDNLVAVATQTGAPDATTLAAAASFTTLADDEDNVPEDVIRAHEASPDGTTIKFNLDKGEGPKQAQLLFEQPTWDAEGNKSDNFKANTQYTYNIVLQTETKEGEVTKVTGEGLPYSLQFTTANEGTTAGVEDVTADDSNAPVQYFNLQGIQVNQPAAGQIYIMRQGKSIKKVLVK